MLFTFAPGEGGVEEGSVPLSVISCCAGTSDGVWSPFFYFFFYQACLLTPQCAGNDFSSHHFIYSLFPLFCLFLMKKGNKASVGDGAQHLHLSFKRPLFELDLSCKFHLSCLCCCF